MSKGITRTDERLVYAMQTLGDKTRFKMFKLLLGKHDLCVSEIANQLNISVPAASQHFKTFEMLGLVYKVREGQKICYQVNNRDKFVNRLTRFMEDKND